MKEKISSVLMKKAAIFCSKGIGDGLLFFVLAHNLALQGWKVICFHELLPSLKSFFPSFEILPYPKENQIDTVLLDLDLIICNVDDRSISKKIAEVAKAKYEKKSFLLYPTTSYRSFAGDFRFNRKVNILENLQNFFENNLKLKSFLMSNGISISNNLIYRKDPFQVIIHAMSRNPDRRWHLNKYFNLARKLKNAGFKPIFCISEDEKKEWVEKFPEDLNYICSKSISELAGLIYESGFFLGNDSGVCHLSAALNIPTFTIFSSKRKKIFWRPIININEQILPWTILPNIKGFRIREKKWQYFLGVWKTYKKFLRFAKKVEEKFFNSQVPFKL